jgi:adenosylcobinamide kinase/adenosylcobinamide-phosphate guanylyltransferase
LKSISTRVFETGWSLPTYNSRSAFRACVRERQERLMQQNRSHSVSLILGGVRSGKSRYAQRLAERSQHVTFVATAEARSDEEMRRKIERHRAERPRHWLTVEEPLDLARCLRSPEAQSELVLIDCLTLYAANLLEAHGEDSTALQQRLEEFYSALAAAKVSVVLVSNEVGSGVVPAYALGRRYRDLVGEINQRVAAIADTAVLMIAGLPLALKGSLDDVRML